MIWIMRWILNCDLIFALDFIDENLLLGFLDKVLIKNSWKNVLVSILGKIY